MDLLAGLSLLHEFFLLGFWQFGEHFMYGEVVSDGVVANGQPDLLLLLLNFGLLIVASFF